MKLAVKQNVLLDDDSGEQSAKLQLEGDLTAKPDISVQATPVHSSLMDKGVKYHDKVSAGEYDQVLSPRSDKEKDGDRERRRGSSKRRSRSGKRDGDRDRKKSRPRDGDDDKRRGEDAEAGSGEKDRRRQPKERSRGHSAKRD